MDTDRTTSDLEPIVAYGARMSWTGLLRPGDRFPRSRTARWATLHSEAGPSLERYFGAWSSSHRRFTLNLSSPRVIVRVGRGQRARDPGLECIVHWIAREDLLRTGPGGACHGDGWPVDLWERFVARRDRLPGTSVGEQLRAYSESDMDADLRVVAEWRRMTGPGAVARAPASGRSGWLPVPARMDSPSGAGSCIVSWSPSPARFASIRDALDSAAREGEIPDAMDQARYYLECRLARFHGVRFGPGDRVVDRAYERRAIVRALAATLLPAERAHIEDPGRGRLDRLGGAGPGIAKLRPI